MKDTMFEYPSLEKLLPAILHYNEHPHKVIIKVCTISCNFDHGFVKTLGEMYAINDCYMVRVVLGKNALLF